MFGINPLAVRPIPDDFDEIRSVFPFGVEGKAGIQSDVIRNVTVAPATSGGGNRFYIDGVENPALTLRRGTKYTFDVSDVSNTGHPLRFKDGNGYSYLTNVIITGVQGNAGATVEITVAADAPDSLRYYCTVHGNGMGNSITVAEFITILIEGNVETTGLSGVSGVGEARFVHFFDVTGEEGTGQVGAPNIALGITIPEDHGTLGLVTDSRPLTPLSGAVGSLDFSLDCVLEVTGVEAEVQLGVPIRFETVELQDGFEAAASVGDINVDLQLDVPQTGLQGTTSEPIVSTITSNTLSILPDLRADASVGEVTLSTENVLAVVGQQATSSVGLFELSLEVVIDQTGLEANGVVEDTTIIAVTDQVISITQLQVSSGFVGTIGELFDGGDIRAEANVLVSGLSVTASTTDITEYNFSTTYKDIIGVGASTAVGFVDVKMRVDVVVLAEDFFMTANTGQSKVFDLVNPSAFVTIDPFESVDLADSGVPIDDVWSDLPAQLAEEDFALDSPPITDTFVPLNLSGDFSGSEVSSSISIKNTWEETLPDVIAPTEPLPEVDTSGGSITYTPLQEELATNTYDEVDVSENTVYNDEEPDQEEFEGGTILDAA